MCWVHVQYFNLFFFGAWHHVSTLQCLCSLTALYQVLSSKAHLRLPRTKVVKEEQFDSFRQLLNHNLPSSHDGWSNPSIIRLSGTFFGPQANVKKWHKTTTQSEVLKCITTDKPSHTFSSLRRDMFYERDFLSSWDNVTSNKHCMC